MRLATIAAASLALGAGAVAARSALPPLTLGEVDFRSMPRAEPGVALYPKAALKARVQGHATVVCTVLRTGDLADCTVTEETPPGYGFGAKVMANAHGIRIYGLSKYGAPTPGRQIEIPMKFTLPPGA